MDRICPACNENNGRKSTQVGFCEKCGEKVYWNLLTKEGELVVTERNRSKENKAIGKTSATEVPVGAIKERGLSLKEVGVEEVARVSSGVSELDRVLGGGFVPSEVVLLASYPGTGKSTLCLSVAENFSKRGLKALYCSGEESSSQIALRGKRMRVDGENIILIHSTEVSELHAHIKAEKPDLLIVDSIQKMYSNDINSVQGSITQSSRCADFITDLTKKYGFISILISQVSKSGDFSGSESIQHAVDATLMFESDENTHLKFLRPVKNRFGDTGEVGVFIHEDDGIKSVSDPSGVLVEESGVSLPGTCITVSSEGFRQIPVEVQALVSASSLPVPRRQFSGVDYNRVQIIAGVLGKTFKGIASKDIFISTVGGIKVKDPMCDLGVAVAMYSSYKDLQLPEKTAFIGEVSLTGAIRGGMSVESKVQELLRMGVEVVYVPNSFMNRINSSLKRKIRVEPISSIKDLARIFSAES